MSIKIFVNDSLVELERDINNFIGNEVREIVDVKYNVFQEERYRAKGEYITYHSIVLIYQ